MKVLVIGKGGREHALVWKLAQSPRAERVYCAPGNPGTALDGTNVPIEANDIDKLLRFAQKENIGLTIVGPEEPLALGLVDQFQKAGLRVFGPTKAAAQLESSKVFAKELMRQADVPTAEFRVFDHPSMARQYITSRDYVVVDNRTIYAPFRPEKLVTEAGVRYLLVEKARPTRTNPRATATVRIPLGPGQPAVVKADGLAAGKGVFVCDNSDEALAAVERIMVREEFGREAGRRVVIEKRLEGEELSVLALVSGRTIVTLPPCQDHKRAFDGDTGPNTGGMGAYCPAPLATPELMHQVEETVLVPTVHAMKRGRRPLDDPAPYRGILYAGLMITVKGARVLEFNCRFGDPECQPLLMRLRSDLLEVLEAATSERLEEALGDRGLEWDERPAVCVVMASKGYPGSYQKGYVIDGLDAAGQLPGVKVFHAGTRRDGDRILTDGGRVLGVTALGDTLEDARRRVYEAVSLIRFSGAHYRRDIGIRGLKAPEPTSSPSEAPAEPGT
jgi:phosphoribosylamine---glycine ligase